MNYKDEVQRIYPEAELKKVWTWYGVYWCGRRLSGGLHINADFAWYTAYNKLKKQGLL